MEIYLGKIKDVGCEMADIRVQKFSLVQKQLRDSLRNAGTYSLYIPTDHIFSDNKFITFHFRGKLYTY